MTSLQFWPYWLKLIPYFNLEWGLWSKDKQGLWLQTVKEKKIVFNYNQIKSKKIYTIKTFWNPQLCKRNWIGQNWSIECEKILQLSEWV